MQRILITIAFLVIGTAACCQPIDSVVCRKAAETFWHTVAPKEYLYDSTAHLADISHLHHFAQLRLYVCPQGFVAVSGNSAAMPIMAYGTQGFDANQHPEHGEIGASTLAWLQAYDSTLQQMQQAAVPACKQTLQAWSALTEDSPADKARQAKSGNAFYLVQQQWNQGWPYNLLCPYNDKQGSRCVTGCVATAMAQIMAYWSYPLQGYGQHYYNTKTYGRQSVCFDSARYQWDLMPLRFSQSSTDEEKLAVSTLMYHCGVAVDMVYGTSYDGGSMAYVCLVPTGSPNVVSALTSYFDYQRSTHCETRSNYADNEWVALLMAEIDAGRPVLYSGSDGVNGHAFVIDGYDDDSLLHVNWGWGGAYDGYFVMGGLNPTGAGIGTNATNTFNRDNTAVVGIVPNKTLKCSPTHLYFGTQGGFASATLSSDLTVADNWTLTKTDKWVTMLIETGPGGGEATTLAIGVLPNNTGTERTATITFHHGARSANMLITQNSCGTIDTFPHLEGFEEGISCWTWQAVTSENEALLGIQTDENNAYSGSKYFTFGSQYSSANYNQYLVSPEIELYPAADSSARDSTAHSSPLAIGDTAYSLWLDLRYKRLYSYDETFSVLASYTDRQTSSFADTLRTMTVKKPGWKQLTLRLPDTVKYVAINYHSANQRQLAVDEVKIYRKVSHIVGIAPAEAGGTPLVSIQQHGGMIEITPTTAAYDGGTLVVTDLLGRTVHRGTLHSHAAIALPAKGIYCISYTTTTRQYSTTISR